MSELNRKLGELKTSIDKSNYEIEHIESFIKENYLIENGFQRERGVEYDIFACIVEDGILNFSLYEDAHYMITLQRKDFINLINIALRKGYIKSDELDIPA